MSDRTLRELLEHAMEEHNETVYDIEAIVVGANSWGIGPETHEIDSVEELEQWSGNTGYGGENLPGIHVWTADRVYLKATYDGSEWVESVPRHPVDTDDIGSVGGG